MMNHVVSWTVPAIELQADYADTCIREFMLSLGLPVTPESAKDITISYYPHEYKIVDGEYRYTQEFELEYIPTQTRQSYTFEIALGKAVSK